MSFIPDTAPFNDEQRAWLNGFFAGLTGLTDSQNQAAGSMAGGLMSGGGTALMEPPAEAEDDFPWHDESLPIADRMELAEGRPVERKLMAAMAQLDCGSCGYLCQTYSEAIASGSEKNLTLCSPGGKETKQMIKKILAEKPSQASASNGTNGAGNGAVQPNGYSRQNPFNCAADRGSPAQPRRVRQRHPACCHRSSRKRADVQRRRRIGYLSNQLQRLGRGHYQSDRG